MSATKKKVSVAILSYNQERFIAQALDSVVDQEVDFDYEIVIADDCSTDGTAAIIARYQALYSDRIRVLPRSRNLGMIKNCLGLYAACRGEYLAYLEGDDYWTSSSKLQRQVDLLDSRPDLALCHHRVRIVSEQTGGDGNLHPPPGSPVIGNLKDLLQRECTVTCSTMLRRLFDQLPAWFEELPILDWPTFVLHAVNGDIGFHEEPMAVYRQHQHGSWSTLSRSQKLPLKIETRQRMARALGPPYAAILEPVIQQLQEELRELQTALKRSPRTDT